VRIAPTTNTSVTVTVIIKSKFVDNPEKNTTDGLSFNNTTVRNFYNTNPAISNLKIIQFGNIPLSRNGSQFSGINNLIIQDTQSPVILQNTSMASMFKNATNFNSDISKWNTINVTNMSNMFFDSLNSSVFNKPIGGWNTSSVTDMNAMFRGAAKFDQNIGNWDTSIVTNMSNMFREAIYFDQPIGNWTTSSVTDMSYMFYNAKSFNQNIGGWTTSKVNNMIAVFYGASVFNRPIGLWDTSIVSDMGYMFYNAKAFNQNIGGWTTNSVNSMGYMFNGATVFNNGQASGLNTQKMNWTISFTGTPPNFSTSSPLALSSSNKPTFR